ncbi:hypothetical protein HPB47_011933 [Ixodes persulcatus]|uniref:Uncharacterized protein n=1 Tax=Ixodes persulcatus TaxID=34615 RepID=A0AC60NV50_IXOPE|nr:hypothetical protein HPB47_011933 [Ixodes persulcatus]
MPHEQPELCCSMRSANQQDKVFYVTASPIHCSQAETIVILDYARDANTTCPHVRAVPHIRVGLEYLLWDCPQHPRVRIQALARFARCIRPTSLHARACLGPSTTSAATMELWQSLLDFLKTRQLPQSAPGFKI